MKGYLAIPLYRDSACTDFYKNLNVIIIDRELADHPGNYTWTASNNSSQIRNNPGRMNWSPFGVKFAFNDFGCPRGKDGYDFLNPEVRDAALNHFRSKAFEVFCSEIANPEVVKSKFSIFSLYEGVSGRYYYFKNGATLDFIESSEDSGGTTYSYLTVRFTRGSNVLSYKYTTGMSPFNASVLYQSDFKWAIPFSVAKDYIDAISNSRVRKGYCGANTVFCVLDNMDGIGYDSIQNALSILCEYFGRGYTGSNGTAGAVDRDFINIRLDAPNNSSAFIGFFSRILGLTSSDNTPEKIADKTGGVLKEDLPDQDGTYPGGGEDLNNYPEDDDGQNTSGKGSFDNTNDPVDWEPLPTFDAASTGFISIWNPNMIEIYDLYSYLWTNDLATLAKKWFINPMDAIISLGYIPVDPIVDGRRNVTFCLTDTGIQMNHVSKQFTEFDFGEIILDEYYGAAWDYSPYTKVQLFLPYIGIQELDVDDVMKGRLHLKYYVDVLTGMISAQLKVTRSRDGLDGIVYTWEGNCLNKCPITAPDASAFINAMLEMAALAGLSLVNPAAGAIAATASASKSGQQQGSKIAGNNWVSPSIAAYSALNVLGQKVHVQRGSRIDANVGVLSPQSAYLIINRPISAIPRGWNEYMGYPSLKIKSLSTQKGFTKVSYIKLDGLEATHEEISELNSILSEGVIL